MRDTMQKTQRRTSMLCEQILWPCASCLPWQPWPPRHRLQGRCHHLHPVPLGSGCRMLRTCQSGSGRKKTCKSVKKHAAQGKIVTLEASSWAARSSSFRAAICWSFVAFFLFGAPRVFGPHERLAEESCEGVISGIPGCADLFLLRVFIKRATESAREISKRQY